MKTVGAMLLAAAMLALGASTFPEPDSTLVCVAPLGWEHLCR